MCSKLLQGCFLLMALTGCSVKEDRSGCACQLQVEVCCPPGPQAVRLCLGGGPEVTVERDTVLVLSAPGPEVVLEATSGALPGPDGSYRIAEGEEQPPLYLFSTRVDTRGETATVKVRLRKEYCLLQLGFRAPADCGWPLGLRVVGEVAGCGPAGEPLPGAFSVETAPDAAGRAAVRLPRQRDASLLLQLLYKDRIVRTFALGEYILSAGYDWEASSLEDMAIEVDIALTNLSLSGPEDSSVEQIDVLV